MSKVVWKPNAALVRHANVTKFMAKQDIATYEDLMQRCTGGIEWFWDACVHEVGIDWFEPYMQIIDTREGLEFAKWFTGGRLNIAHNCVDRYGTHKKHQKKVAVHWEGECGARVELTYRDLYEQSQQVAVYLESIGVERGDAVALYMPMIPELVPIFFGIMKMGAVVVPIFSGFGPQAVVDRLESASVKAIFTIDGSLRRGKELSVKKDLDEALKHTKTVSKCIVVKRLHNNAPMQSGRDVYYDDSVLIAGDSYDCAELPSEHPCLYIHTSGTTGKPKGTVHTHAGTLAQVVKEHYFHFDFKEKDTFFWVTDIGWMMGPWELIGSLHLGGTVVLFEGAPNYPKSNRLLKLAQDTGTTHFGVSPTLIRMMMKEGLQAGRTKIKTLRFIGSTSEPWDEDSYMWCFEKIGQKKAPIMNISGGTELMGCLLAPLPIQELKACSLQGPALGMAVDIFNEEGGSVADGEVGYLVCRKPAPSMTRGFLGDKQRFLDTYYSKFTHVWNHGDWALRDEDGQWFIRGRADDTIKVAGKRTGPAEIESSLCDNPFVNEACAIGVPDKVKGQKIVCFVVLKDGVGHTRYLKTDLKNKVCDDLGKTLKPSQVHIVKALPKTRSGKIVRGLIKKKFLGKDLGALTSVENPDLLKGIPSSN